MKLKKNNGPRTHTAHRRKKPQDTENRSLTELIKELRDESSHLLRQEVALAKTEMSEKVSADHAATPGP